MEEKSTKYTETISRWLKTAGVGFIIVFGGFMLTVIIRDHNKRMGPWKPMLSEAKELDLNFEQVTKEPDKYLNKHVIWCVQNISQNQVYYRGDLSRPITVFNYQQMPLFQGSKHSNCTDMLLQIKGARHSAPVNGRVGVMFIYPL